MVEKGFIDREVAFDMITDLAGKATTKAAYAAIWKSAKELNKIPTADVIKVVRCKDCKYNNTSSCPTFVECDDGKDFQMFENNDFCSCGERR